MLRHLGNLFLLGFYVLLVLYCGMKSISAFMVGVGLLLEKQSAGAAALLGVAAVLGGVAYLAAWRLWKMRATGS